MTNKEEALRMALEALEAAKNGSQPKPIEPVIAALRQALEQQPAVSDEPVAWMWQDGTLTTDPDRADGTWTHLYTSPQKREWVGLTDRERDQFFKYVTMTSLVKAIEAKLKEKNT